MGTLRLRRTSQVLLAAIALSALPRLLLLPVNEHLYGDAIPRTELAEQWARSPHVITAFGDGAMQFGPLHLYLIAAALPWFDRADAARVLSLVFGLLAAPVLFVLARRLFGWRAAVVAVAGLAVWGLHIQFSTTGGSEALSLCLTLAALAAFAAGLDSRRTRDFAAAGICLTLACAVRYDPWVYVVLLPASVVLTRRRRGALPVAGAAAFVAAAVSYPVFWMVGNHLMHGQALYPFTFIDVEHARLASLEAGGWREAWLRLQGMTFWPAMLVVSLTPGVGLLAAAGLVRAWRNRADTRWLIVTVYMPLVYYAVRTTILFDFVPLVRFLAVPLAVALIFVREGYLELAGRWGGRRARQAAVAAAVLAVAMPAVIGAMTFRVDGRVADVLRSISPASTNPRALMTAARVLQEAVRQGSGPVAVDSDERYRDITVVFFSRLDDQEVERVRWPAFDVRFDQKPATLVLLFEDGTLAARPDVDLAGPSLVIRGIPYLEVGGVQPPMRLFRRLDASDGKITVCPDRRVLHYEHASRSQPAPVGCRTADTTLSAGRIPARRGIPRDRSRGSRRRGPQGREQGAPRGTGADQAGAGLQPLPGAVRSPGRCGGGRAVPAGRREHRGGRAGDRA